MNSTRERYATSLSPSLVGINLEQSLRSTPQSPLFYFLATAVLAVVYFFTAQLGLKLGSIAGVATPIWPPTGISLAALLIFGFRLWPGITLGAFFINILATHSVPAALGIAVGNTLEAVMAVYFLQRIDFQKSLTRHQDVLALLGIAALGCTLFSAIIGTASSWFWGITPPPDFIAAFRTWWLGDIMSNLVVMPFLLIWWRRTPAFKVNSWKIIEEVLTYLLMVFVAGVLLSGGGGPNLDYYIRPHIFYPFLMWATYRYGQRGSVTATLILSVVLTWETSFSLGPFVSLGLTENLLALQIFIGTLAITFLFVGAIVNERRQAEISLRKAIQIREDFVGIVSHDLKNPVGSILLNAQIIARMTSTDQKGKDIQRQTEILKRTAYGMQNLIENLLDFTKLESGTFVIESRPEEAQTLIDKSLEILRPLAEEKSIQLTKDVGNISHKLYCDQERTLQVLSNLIGNAVKFTPPHGSIRIVVEEKDAQAHFLVEDTGPGIPPEQIPHIFDRYWQGKQNDRHSVGLGLSIAKGIIEAHKGHIWAENRANENGALFHFTLPTIQSSFFKMAQLTRAPDVKGG